MRRLGLFTMLALIWSLGAAAHAAPSAPVWFDWKGSRDGVNHTYTAEGLTLTVTTAPGQDQAGPVPVLTVAAPGAAPVTLTGVSGFDDPTALIGLVRLDPASPHPQVLFQTFSFGAHCCTTLRLATFTDGGWRTFALTYDGPPDKAVVKTDAGTGPPVLAIGDENFDYAFASHAGSVLVARFYAVRAGQLHDVSAEPRFAAAWRATAADMLGYCRGDGERNGACAAYVAEASLGGEHAAAWRQMLTHYDRTSTNWPTGCRIDADEDHCPKADVITFKSLPPALAWFLWRQGYAPAAPTFACPSKDCPVPRPRTPAP